MIGQHKLTEDRAEVIKALLKGGEHTHQQIANLCTDIWGFTISREMITKINMGHRWNEERRSFKMKDRKVKSNDFRQFTPTRRVLTDGDIKVIEKIIKENIERDYEGKERM